MKISLIVTTNNRPLIFERLLKSIVENKYNNLEVIVVDQNNKHINNKVIDKYINLINIKHIYIGQIISLSKARNIGITYATGDIIGYPDDDCWYPTNFFKDLCEKFIDYKVNAICTSVYDPISKKIYGNKKSSNLIDEINFNNVIKFTTSVGIFVKAEGCIEKFDEYLGVGAKWYGGEDIDYVCNLIYKGKRVLFIDSLKVYHEVEPQRSVEKEYYYSVGAGAVIKKMYSFYKYKGIFLFYIQRQLKALTGMLLFMLSNRKEFTRYKNKFEGINYGFKNWR